MKYLYFLFLIVVLQESVAKKRVKRSKPIPQPDICGLVLNEDDSVTVKWYPLTTGFDVVQGFIVNIWEIEGEHVFKSLIINGRDAEVLEILDAKLDPRVIPEDPPLEIEVPGDELTNATFSNIKLNVQYHIRVQAYSSDSRGPQSAAVGLKVKK